MVFARCHWRTLGATLLWVALWALAGPSWATDINFYPVGNVPTGLYNIGLREGSGVSQDDAKYNLDAITDAIVTIYQNDKSGTLYFHLKGVNAQTYYCISSCLRILPYINIRGVSYDGTPLPNDNQGRPNKSLMVIKNIKSDVYSYTESAVLFCGFDGPDSFRNDLVTPYIQTYRRAFKTNEYPTKNTNRISIKEGADWVAGHMGDEIQILSGGNTKIDKKNSSDVVIAKLVRPDYMFKAVITSKSSNAGNYYYYLDKPIPFDFPVANASKVGWKWSDEAAGGDIPIGEPCWFLVKEWYSTTQPSYWVNPAKNGYKKYQKLGEDYYNGEGDKWIHGWTTHHCIIQDITLQSLLGNVTTGSGPRDSQFTNCILKGQKCLFFNACQYTTFDNSVVCYFWDNVGEFSYNSLSCILDGVTCLYISGLQPPASSGNPAATDGPGKAGGMLTIHENSRGFRVNNLTINAANRSVVNNTNSMIRVVGSDNIFGETDPPTTNIFLTAPQMAYILYVATQDNIGPQPIVVTFTNMSVDQSGYAPTVSPVYINWPSAASPYPTGPTSITVSNTTFSNSSSSPCNLRFDAGSESLKNIVLGPGLVMPGLLEVNADMHANGLNILTVHKTGCNFAGHTTTTPQNIEPYGAMGTYDNTINWQD